MWCYWCHRVVYLSMLRESNHPTWHLSILKIWWCYQTLLLSVTSWWMMNSCFSFFCKRWSFLGVSYSPWVWQGFFGNVRAGREELLRRRLDLRISFPVLVFSLLLPMWVCWTYPWTATGWTLPRLTHETTWRRSPHQILFPCFSFSTTNHHQE